MFEIVRTKIIQCAFKIKKKYIDVSRLQLLHHQWMIAFNYLFFQIIEVKTSLRIAREIKIIGPV